MRSPPERATSSKRSGPPWSARGAATGLPGIRAAVAALDPAPGDAAWTARDRLRAAASIYRSMTRGPGSFGDFYIARADPAEQAEANQRYGKLADELWALLGDVR